MRSNLNHEEFNSFCFSLPSSTYVRQWRGKHVWKIGDKLFAIGAWLNHSPAWTFKVTQTSFEILKDRRGFRPAPYFASRGLSWIQYFSSTGVADGDFKLYLRNSYEIVRRGLGKKKIELGLN